MKVRTILIVLIYYSRIILITEGSCNFHGKSYEDGEIWNSTCHLCQCHSNSISCTKIACPLVDCSSNEIPSHHDNCCPPCNSFKKACSDGENSYVHNDVWFTSTECILNQCQDGIVVPHIIQCPGILCPKGEKLEVVPGECCPKCISTACLKNEAENLSSECVLPHSNASNDCSTTHGITENLAVVNKDSCTLCIYDGSVEKCYKQKCPPCSFTSISLQNNSCCSCVASSNLCSKDCKSCESSDKSYCLECSDAQKVLHEGKCLDKCPPGYFSDEQNKCRNCSSSCKTCFGNMTSQCTSCNKGYLVQKGRCVKNCDANYYTSGNFCFECNEACLSCHGPNSNDCISCPLPGQLLQDGSCVDSCIGHHYVSDGYCLECNASCARCLKDGTCQFCVEDYYLEESYCEPECTPGYYAFLDAYCLSCHEECQSCFGPLPFQCTSCPFGQFLLENSCVWDCGQGYFGDLGAGICRTCHEDCRSCLGGASGDKCLTCSSGYLLPYIGTHFGTCVEKCPDGYYLTANGVCEICHESCESCFGANETDCLTCKGASLFFKDGKCVPHCSNGFFQEHGQCYACHPSCATCYGFNEDECYTCPHGRRLKFDKCIPACKEGNYMDLDGSCKDCDPSCQDCLLNNVDGNGVHCLLCKYPQHSIMHGQCNVGCPPNFYLSSNKICIECHHSCATCERSGATACVTCWNGNVLTHLGTCESQCHRGYFPVNGVCQACNVNCHHCISATECLQCKGDLVLQSGVCIQKCHDQHYVDGVSRKCTGCSKECSTCRGPNPDDCTSCIVGRLFQDGSCVESCSEGFFQNQNNCEPCDLKCKTCSSVNKCTSCDVPLLLSKGECVDDCGSGQFADYETLRCKACTDACAYCLGPDLCGLCYDGFYFFENTCIQSCPDHHYSDSVSRICTRNEEAPSLDVNKNLILGVGSYILISTAVLNVSDAESEKLFILVSDVPQNSYFVKMSDAGDEILMKPGDNFTSSQLEDGWVFLKQSQGSLEGDLSLKITDGQLSSDKINLPLQVTSKFSPLVYQIGYIVIPEESFVTINSSSIFLEDADNIDDVSLNIIQGSCHGKLVTVPDEKEVTKMTYKEFSRNQLVYKSLKTNATVEDSFVIQVFDGFNAAMTDVKIIIIHKDQPGVIIVHNKPFYVRNDTLAKLTNDVLLAVGEKLKPSDIVYEIDRSKNPSFGKIFKNTNDFSSSYEMKEEKVIFSQEDIDKELLSLTHFTSNSSKVIKIKVSDTYSNFGSEFNFEIHPIKSDYDSPMQEVQYGMMVLQNHAATITNDHLSFQASGVSPNNIVYMITKKLLKEEGFLENLNKPGIRLQSFTQNDVNNLKIIYHPPSYGAASDKQFMFQFVVIDAKSGSQLSPVQNFTITLTPPNSDFTSPASAIDYESIVLLGQGESAELGHHWLSTAGHQLPEDQLEVVLTNAPLHGKLVQRTGGVELEIGEEDGFSFSSIIQDMFYDHDGSTNLHDSAVFSIMGGRQSTLNRVMFEITPNDRESPVILDSTTLMGSVTEGKILILQRHHLAFTDLISGDSEIVFTLLLPPKYGKLEKQLQNGNYKELKPTDQFTQQDINENKIRYVANTGIGDDTVREFLYFDVADASGNVQSKQVLTIKVRPRIKEPPILKVIKDILVNEGGEAVIEPNILTVFDPDTPLSDLKIVIDKQPDYGFIENSKPIPGAENTLAGIPVSSFPYIDLIEGYVKYMQTGHQGVEPDKDTVFIHVQDGRLSSPSQLVNITIRSMNDEIPHVYTDVLSVFSRGYVKLSNSTLFIVDADTMPDQLVLTLDVPPHYGVIKKLKQKSLNLRKSKTIILQDSFTFQDVLDGLILYMHEDFKSLQNDTFALIVSDGEHLDYASFTISVIMSDREVPYLVRNLGLELTPGNSSIIDSTTLKASDADSPDEMLLFIITSYPTAGQLLIQDNGQFKALYAEEGKLPTVTQKDINERRLKYQHTWEDDIGMHYFKFNVQDPANNTLLDQTYFITVSEDIFPPIITRNTGLEVPKNGRSCLNSDVLAAVDEHKKSQSLVVSVTIPPSYGHLEFVNKRNTSISNFLMSDVEARKVCYVHTSTAYAPLDSFTFTLSDGKNSVLQAFYINITSEHTGIPVVKISPLVVKEGSKKVLSEFEIDVFDEDTQDNNILINITKYPAHGVIKNNDGLAVNVFSLNDLKQNLLYYWHDNSETVDDSFSFKISDGSKKGVILFNSGNTTTSSSIELPIKIIPVDDVSPLLVNNYPFFIYRHYDEGVRPIITNETLLAIDSDTVNKDIVFKITLQPKLGYLQLSSNQGEKISLFTQRDIDEGKLEYILSKDDLVSTEDGFMFLIEDTNRNRVPNQVFKIKWNRFSFTAPIYNVSETEEMLRVPIVQLGKHDMYLEVTCDEFAVNAMKNKLDFIVPIVKTAHFEPQATLKECVYKLIDNIEFEGAKQFKISLKGPFFFGLHHEAIVNIFDEEDEPVISFPQVNFRVDETGKMFNFPVVRKGDTKQELSFICETNDVTAKGSSTNGLETGSDYRSRLNDYNNFITFSSGSNETFCSIEIIDDNLYEEEEIFQLKLSRPHPFGKLRGNTTATVIINGPNDVPEVFFAKLVPQVYFSQSNLSITLSRVGVDLSKNCSVQCGLSWSANGENMTTFHKIEFGSFDKTIDFEFTFEPFESEGSSEGIGIFLNSPKGCILKDPYSIDVPLKRKIVKPSIEFDSTHLVVNENSTVSIPIQRSGDISNVSSVYCITHDGTAISRKDFEERYITRKTSIITFNPEQKASVCVVKIYDDEIHEGIEKFTVELVASHKDTNALIGRNGIITLEISDPEDATVIQLAKSDYIVNEQVFPKNVTTSVTVPVLRYGDTTLVSKVRVSTIDGSAASGVDYYGKSKILTFLPGERQKNFVVEILYNKRRSWALTFTVILGPDEVLNAIVGNVSKAVVKIASVQSTESLILPAVPIVVSLKHYDNVTKGLMENPRSGYPLICITPCDENYPDYATTSSLCKDSSINSSSMKYSWEIAMPLGKDRISAFELVSQSTLFTSAHHKVLDSIYFRPQEHIRCVVQPQDSKGVLGIPLRSRSIKISSDIGFCHSSIQKTYSPLSLQSQPFVASLEYINSTGLLHPNQLHIHIEIPHEDGLLPIISTYPLHNIEFLLTQKIYRQQHVCSNIQLRSTSTKKENFLKSPNPNSSDISTAFPFHGDQCEKEAHLLYQHLNLKKCTWSFDAWYSMSELVELCGGSVTSDFKTRDTDQTYSTVLLPLYVTYVFAAAPTGWTSVEHRTELEFSFFYETFLWKSGSYFDDSINATLAVVRVGTNPDGNMFFEFKTVAKFHGCFVVDHHTLPDVKSYVTAPNNINVKFNLELLWSEQTFDGPMQFWRATSSYNLKDYSGLYSLHLVPCKVMSSNHLSVFSAQKYLPCIAQMPERFELPLTFQQTSRPSPVTYALETFFQLFNDKNSFLMNPFENSPVVQYVEYKGPYSKGDKTYGRVFWSPKQGLESGYKLTITEVILCAGKNGYIPTYDPSGQIYGKGPQYGCLLPNKNLKYKFILLDKNNPDAITEQIDGISFNAKFIDEVTEFSSISTTSGVDGFVFNIEPLYQISSSQQWFLQVIYKITPKQKSRMQRSVDELSVEKERNESNIKVIFLENSKLNTPVSIARPVTDSKPYFYLGAHHLLYIISALLVILCIYVIWSKRNLNKIISQSKTNSYTVAGQYKSLPYPNLDSTICEIQCKQKVKHKKIYKIKVHSSSRSDFKSVGWRPTETEV